jgi:hypothetical protein
LDVAEFLVAVPSSLQCMFYERWGLLAQLQSLWWNWQHLVIEFTPAKLQNYRTRENVVGNLGGLDCCRNSGIFCVFINPVWTSAIIYCYQIWWNSV